MVKHIPNILSAFRILDLVIIIIFMENNLHLWAVGFFSLGVLSDILDGFIARRNNVVTTYGKIMDPLADKILVIGILIAMINILSIPYWAVIVIVAREFAVTGLRIIAADDDIIIPANKWGKLKTSSQFATIVLLMLGYQELGVIFLYVAVVLTVISGYVYFYDYFRAIK